METRAEHLPSDNSSAPAPTAAAYPPWILLGEYFFGGRGDPDTKTVARARTAKGRPISISLVLAAPPAVSRLRLDSPGMPQLDGHNVRSYAIAAHGDSVLVKIENNGSTCWDDDDDRNMSDYFIYCAGDAAAHPSRPPSLSLLPPCYMKGRHKEKRNMDFHGTALLRRGQDEVLVAALRYWLDNGEGSQPVVADLCMLRSHDWQWELKKLPVIHDEGKREEVSCWATDRVIPIGDRFVLWVDYLRGIILCPDLWQETPQLRYLSLPVQPDMCASHIDRNDASSYRSISPTDGGRAIRFVEVSPRCCCGCPGATACAVSRHAFSINMWALRMDDMTTWDKVGVVDCQELWSLPGYHGIVPRIRPTYPTVDLHDPDVLCLVVHKTTYHKGVDGDLGTRRIKLDTRSMELRSVCYYDPKLHFFPHFIASAVSQYFDASSRSHAPAGRIDAHLEASARPLKLTFHPKAASPQEMLGTLREIPDLAPDDMMKVYGILSYDESLYKFRSLLALPIDMRKDYCHLIIKLSRFDV